jgi:hypothetical protein
MTHSPRRTRPTAAVTPIESPIATEEPELSVETLCSTRRGLLQFTDTQRKFAARCVAGGKGYILPMYRPSWQNLDGDAASGTCPCVKAISEISLLKCM